MSSLNVILKNSSVHVLVDGAAYDREGKFICETIKAWPLVNRNAIVAFRGAKSAVPALVDVLSVAPDFASLKPLAAELIAGKTAPNIRQIDSAFEHVELAIAGLNDAGEPEAFTVASCDRGDMPAGSVVPIPKLLIAPASPEVLDAIVSGARTDADIDAESFDPAVDGLRLLEAQREHVEFLGKDGAPIAFAGGHVLLMSVSASGITSRVLYKWNDVAGEHFGGARKHVRPEAKPRKRTAMEQAMDEAYAA